MLITRPRKKIGRNGLTVLRVGWPWRRVPSFLGVLAVAALSRVPVAPEVVVAVEVLLDIIHPK